MPRANRHFLSGHVWHVTHRCHERNFLFKFAWDRKLHASQRSDHDIVLNSDRPGFMPLDPGPG